MRLLCVCLAAAVAGSPACGTEIDPWPKRPASGGPGGSADPVDAGDTTDADAVDEALLGRVCVIGDFRAPFDCPDIPLGRGVQVKDVPTVNMVVSDDATLFTIPATTATVVLEVGGVVGDGLRPTLSVIRNDSGTAREDVPVIEQALWDTMLVTIPEAEVAGAMVVYVVDGTGTPVANATVTHATPAGGQRTYYDDGFGGWDPDAITTGPDGIALILDTVGGQVGAAAAGFTGANTTIPTRTNAVGIGVIRLTAAP